MAPTRSRAEVKERVELYVYSPSGPSWTVLGRPLPLPVTWGRAVPLGLQNSMSGVFRLKRKKGVEGETEKGKIK